MGQLWFILVLFIVFMVVYPLIVFSNRRGRNHPLSKYDLLLLACQFLSTLALSCLSYLIIAKRKSDFWDYVVPTAVLLDCFWVAVFGVQIIFQRYAGEIHWSAVLSTLLIGPLTHLGFNQFKYGTDEKSMYSASMMTFYHTVFFSQGMLFGVWRKEYFKAMQEMQDSVFMPFMVTFSVMAFSVTQPGNYSDVGFMFFYPLYSSKWIQGLFTSGSWLIIYLFNFLFHAAMNKRYDEQLYHHFNNSSMFTYLCHDLWIHVICSSLIYPNSLLNEDERFSIGTALLIVIVFVEIASYLNYFAFAYLFFGRHKKEK
uniref:Uncharacterized protein n=1 Tax=Strombidium rassoulzadegani TaxID=1082188 RepID=A0A7S3FVQ1_9SPIT|mmetsp:Transcript_3101/g.5215  ORF Transcript_3101/g.5215 Transcript_3101/m.5215 type:complete len:312 (+) Transcript_3101:649-1584(+)